MKKLYGPEGPIIPKYIQAITERLIPIPGPYMYRLEGFNPSRPKYGLPADYEKLKAWAERHGADCVLKRECHQPRNHYITIELTDPVCHALEKAGILKK